MKACVNGHLLTPDNTYVRPGRGYNDCKECIRVRNKARKRGNMQANVPLDVIRLRRMLGIPDDGPTEEMRRRWHLQEMAGA